MLSRGAATCPLFLVRAAALGVQGGSSTAPQDSGKPALTPKQARALKLRQQLQEQQQRADEGVMACLPLIAGAAHGELGGGEAPRLSGHGGAAGGEGGAGRAAKPGTATSYSRVPTVASLEYARNRGIYKGEQLSW